MDEKLYKPEDVIDGINEYRMLCLLECPKGHFHQFLFTPEQFKTVSDTIAKTQQLVGYDKNTKTETLNIAIGDIAITHDTFIGMKSSYTPEEIKSIMEDDGEED